MDHVRQTREIIVIGAGLGGLAAAAMAARGGARVRILDGASHPGGRARSRIQEGFTLNAGAHALYRRGPAERALRELGVAIEARTLRKHGAYGLMDDQLHELPYAPLSLLRTPLLAAGEKLGLLRVLASLGERKARSLRGKTVEQWLDEAASTARLRALLSMLVRLCCYANAPGMLGADAAVRQIARVVQHNVMYVDGGWQSLVDALLQRVRDAGVIVELGVSVAEIEHTSGAASGVRTSDGRRFAAEHVIATVDPPALARLLPHDATAAHWARAALPLRAACLDLGVRELPHPERLNVQALDAPLYFSNHSAYAKLAPEGCQLLSLVHYLAPGEDGRDSEPLLRSFVERIQPGVYNRAVLKRFLPSLTVHTDLPGAERARSVHPQIAGLSLVSDVSSPRFMLADAVLDSARAAAQRALKAPQEGDQRTERAA